jgi:hypothetical protein
MIRISDTGKTEPNKTAKVYQRLTFTSHLGMSVRDTSGVVNSTFQ